MLPRMNRLLMWIALGVLAVSCSSCAVGQLAGRTASNTVKGIGQAASAASAAF